MPTPSLRRRAKNATRAWEDYEAHYECLRNIASDHQEEEDRASYANLQRHYLDTKALAEDVLEANKDDDDLRPRALTKEQRIQQHTSRWRGAHHRLDVALEEVKTSLEGTALDSLELIEVKEAQLLQLQEHL